jgi:hypothetical protein
VDTETFGIKMTIDRDALMTEMCSLIVWEYNWFANGQDPARIGMLKESLNTEAKILEADIANLDKQYRELLSDKTSDNSVRVQVMNEKNEKAHRLEDIHRTLDDPNKIAIAINKDLCQIPIYKSHSARQREITDLLWKR